MVNSSFAEHLINMSMESGTSLFRFLLLSNLDDRFDFKHLGACILTAHAVNVSMSGHVMHRANVD